MSVAVGDLLTGIQVGAVAHGGHFVARHEGQVIFVRGSDTGEVVDVRITETNRRFARGETIAVHQPSPHRVTPPCPVAGRCGGCDFQHLSVQRVRELKAAVVAEQLSHLAGIEFTSEVVAVEPTPFGWRSRMRYHYDSEGQAGLRAHRSTQIVPLPEQGCLLACESIAVPPPWSPGTELLAVAADSGTVFAPAGARDRVRQSVGGRSFEVDLDGFWQAHISAPEVLTDAVMNALEPRDGEVAADLYCGVGLFAGALAGAGVSVLGIEGDRKAVELARRNVSSGAFLAGDVAVLVDRLPSNLDLVVLDPPRSGAGTEVMTAVLGRSPRAVAYVACDPAALGRDLRQAIQLGYEVAEVTAFDLFPLTHHIECVAILKSR